VQAKPCTPDLTFDICHKKLNIRIFPFSDINLEFSPKQRGSL